MGGPRARELVTRRLRHPTWAEPLVTWKLELANYRASACKPVKQHAHATGMGLGACARALAAGAGHGAGVRRNAIAAGWLVGAPPLLAFGMAWDGLGVLNTAPWRERRILFGWTICLETRTNS